MNDVLRESLRTVLNPKSIAVIGASENENKIGGRPLLYLSRHGYQGKVYPINPKRAEIQGFKAYPALTEVPAAPEAAIVALAGDAAIEAVEQCATRGVKTTVVMTSGFGETDPIAGKAKEKRMRDAAHAKGMRIVGPNTQGLINFAHGDVYMLGRLWEWWPVLELEKGQSYRLHLSSVDWQHGFSLQPININVQVHPGYEHVLTVTPNSSGEYTIVCNEYCGLGHHTMLGKIFVTDGGVAP